MNITIRKAEEKDSEKVWHLMKELAVFEKYFGQLWGHGNSNLTEEQKHYRQVWEEARTDILNNGNTQMRIAQEEIAQYTMTWNRYKTEFIIKDLLSINNCGF